MHKIIPLTNPIGQPYGATESEKTVPEDDQEELRRPASSEDNVPNCRAHYVVVAYPCFLRVWVLAIETNEPELTIILS